MPYLEDVHAVVGHHAQLGVLDGDEVLFIERLTARDAVINYSCIARLRLHISSSATCCRPTGQQSWRSASSAARRSATPTTPSRPGRDCRQPSRSRRWVSNSRPARPAKARAHAFAHVVRDGAAPGIHPSVRRTQPFAVDEVGPRQMCSGTAPGEPLDRLPRESLSQTLTGQSR